MSYCVPDGADDLLDEVLEGHDARGTTVLVDHDGHVHLALLHLAEQLADVLGLGGEVRLARNLRERALIVADDAMAEQVLCVDHTDDVVDALLVDRDARVAGVDDQPDDVCDGVGGLRGDDVDSRNHHLAYRLVGHLEDAVDHLPLLLLDDPLLLTDVEEEFQLLFSHERAAHATPPGRRAHDQSRERAQAADQRPEHAGEEADRARERQREALVEPERE